MIIVLVKLTLMLAAAWLAIQCLRRASPAVKHAVALAALLSAGLLPPATAVLPAWEVLPAQAIATPAETRATMARPVDAVARNTGEATPPVNAVTVNRASSGLLIWLWLAGTGALVALLMCRVFIMHRSARRAQPLRVARWQQRLADARLAQGVRQPVQLLLREPGSMPAAWGVFRPVILLPRDCLEWPAARCRDVLNHELAHVVRGDVATRLLAHLICALYWFHPLVWLLKRRLLAEAELAADDRAVVQAVHEGVAPVRYADHLLQTTADCRAIDGIAPVMAAHSHLETRIMAILATDRNRTHTTRNVRLVIATLSMAACVATASISRAQPGTVIGSGAAIQYEHSHSSAFAAHLETLGIDARDIDALLIGLGSSEPLTRAASAWALGNSDEERVVAPLVQTAYDSDAVARQWAVRSLAAWTQPAVAQALVDRLQDTDAEVRQWAVRSLNRHDPAVKTRPMMTALNDSDAEVREWAARGLADAGGDEVRKALASRLAVETNGSAAEWLVRSLNGSAGNVEALVGATQNPSAEVRQWAARGLGGQHDERAVDALIALLGDGDAEVREWSVRGLAVCGNERAVPALAGMADDSNAEVRDWARRALEAIDC